MVVAGCVAQTADPPSTADSPTTVLPPPIPRPVSACRPALGVLPTVVGDDPTLVGLQLSAQIFGCPTDVVVTEPGDSARTQQASALAISLSAPLLVYPGSATPEFLAELKRLDPIRIHIAGQARLVRELAPYAQVTGVVLRFPDHPIPPNAGSGDRLPVWLVPGGDAELTAVLAAAAAATNAELVPVEGDLRASEEARRLLFGNERPAAMVGDWPSEAGWQLGVVRKAEELPGGGLLMFPGRRLVSFYGTPGTASLGVLGEQGPEATIGRLRPIGAEYEADGTPVVPTFEIIATVASSKAGADADYSDEIDIDYVRPWIDLARQEGLYVVLDLQPGRTDFLTQAQRYEELLKEPHVGLALDPEWRLRPDQVHLRQIGSVDAAEVNTVVEWLAALVRDNSLPQKLLIVHQFNLMMITHRTEILTPSELAVVIQMDGQGPIGSKYGTYEAITAGVLDEGWNWGWKNFYDEDSPTATPAQVLDLEPVPVFVSYQ